MTELHDEVRPKSLAHFLVGNLSGEYFQDHRGDLEAEILGLNLLNSGPIGAPKFAKNGLEFA